MISVIVCSVQPRLFAQLEQNIEQTIGVPYEVLKYDNRASSKGLCAVYNLMAAQARYSLLCFVHEDVLFRTKNWGKLVQAYLVQEGGYRLLGVAGAKYKAAACSGWYTGQATLDCAHVVHQFPKHTETLLLQPGNNAVEDVVCLDGVFLCCTGEVWRDIKFDEQLLHGFHFYDVDFSLRTAARYKVGVCYNLELVHITAAGGDFGNPWVTIALDYHERRKEMLPVSCAGEIPVDMEKRIAKAYLDVLKNQVISMHNKLLWIRVQKLHNMPELYYSIAKFLFYRPLRLNRIHHYFKRK